MDNKEAIELLKKIRSMQYVTIFGRKEDELTPKQKKAVTMAIAALEQQEKDKWRPVSDGMPEEHKWMGTEHFGTTISDEVYVTVEVPSGERITKHMHFQNGAIPPFEQRSLDAFYKGGKAVAWRPLPEAFQGE